MNLEGKVAVVTGSTSGIGLGMAVHFAKLGAQVVINGLGDEQTINTAIDQASFGGKTAHYNGADMRDADAISSMIEEVEAKFGSVDILVNNAGIQHVSRVENFPADRWNDVIAINLSSAFHAIKAALPGMQKRNYGRIINIASVHGQVASVEKSAYVAAKHGIIGLTKVVALENAEQHITCNAICPGWVRTPLVEAQIEALAEKEGLDTEAAAKQLLASKEPSLRFATPEQLAETAAFLCSDAASNMTGVNLTLDGGWTAQ
ncbi:3-hydroxybutyrate dehydrogenase [Sneathiella sp. P13V-1]|uniref:3-hydroxybutyrate dehydrogenase n=1 Tax=Sneathiella sp. P13V-1 TaxID=2697366 RepID=UPI00187B8820|nr:3-hydroxybutyrate dehydrogenase [Sneathiella sp. P13V-1]MBE7638628.1 3-hydroxybutyrate dehydrogenase [Sneathiella sp. P13V-1]